MTRTEQDLAVIRERLADEPNIQAKNSESVIQLCQQLLQAPETSLEEKMKIVSIMQGELQQ